LQKGHRPSGAGSLVSDSGSCVASDRAWHRDPREHWNAGRVGDPARGEQRRRAKRREGEDEATKARDVVSTVFFFFLPSRAPMSIDHSQSGPSGLVLALAICTNALVMRQRRLMGAERGRGGSSWGSKTPSIERRARLFFLRRSNLALPRGQEKKKKRCERPVTIDLFSRPFQCSKPRFTPNQAHQRR